MESEDEQGDEEEEPDENEEESNSKESDHKPACKSTRQTGSDDESDVMSWTAQVKVAPHMP